MLSCHSFPLVFSPFFPARLSKQRRLFLGPVGTIDFFSYDSIWIQVHEMLFAETIRGREPSEDQIAEELEAYNSMLPQGGNLPFTLFFEVNNEERRRELLSKLASVEHQIVLEDGKQKIAAKDLQSDIGEYKTDAQGKTSAVHFLSFEGLKARDLTSSSTIICTHPAYPHSVRIHEELLQELKKQLQ